MARISQQILGLASATALTLAMGASVWAGPHGGGRPAGVPGGMHMPAMPNPASVPGHQGNPNGVAPIGKPATHGDTDRGRSEGKGHNDRKHGKHAMQTIRGRVVGMTKNTVTLQLPNGKTETILVSSSAVANMHLKPGTNIRVISPDGGKSATEIKPGL